MMDLTWYLLPKNVFSSSVALVFGLFCGSFLNVLIYRLPIMIVNQCVKDMAQIEGSEIRPPDTFNLAFPASFCEFCHRPLRFWENIPLFSYLVLKGRCRTCQAKIALRIPLVEAFCGLACAWMVWFLGISLFCGAVLFFLFSVLALALIDWDEHLLPDVIVYPLMWAGLLCSVHGLSVPPRDAVLGTLFAYIALWLLRLMVSFKRPDAMGDGDLKLAAALGAWIGVGSLSWMFVIASVSALLFALVSIRIRRSSDGLHSAIPFGPFLGMAGVMLFFKMHLPFPVF